MISLLAAAGLLASSPACAPVEGSDALWREDLRFVAVGEMHGTVEAPAAFADLVCLALDKGPVTVLLEYPIQMQPTFDAFMAEPDADAARDILLAYPHGPFRYHDGRGSEAMLAMFQRFRSLHQAGGDLKLLASVPDSPRVEGFTQSHSELDRAQLWSSAARAAPDRRMMIFVGSVHAGKARRLGSSLGLPAAAPFPSGRGSRPLRRQRWRRGLELPGRMRCRCGCSARPRRPSRRRHRARGGRRF